MTLFCDIPPRWDISRKPRGTAPGYRLTAVVSTVSLLPAASPVRHVVPRIPAAFPYS